MQKESILIRFAVLLAIAAVLVFAGCTAKETEEPADEAAVETSAEGIAGDENAAAVTLVSQLAAADALDGKVDKVVTRCASCRLGMDGSDEHTIEVSGYTMYFCAEGCKGRFGEDVEASVLAMTIPK